MIPLILYSECPCFGSSNQNILVNTPPDSPVNIDIPDDPSEPQQ